MRFGLIFLSLLVFSSQVYSKQVFKGRLECIHELTPVAQKSESSIFTYQENVKDMSLLEFSSALIHPDSPHFFMTLPSARGAERGVYIFINNTSFWHKLPRLATRGEFSPLYYKIDNPKISKSPMYLTYYDGVEKDGREYSNKSVGLSQKKAESQDYSEISLVELLDNNVEDSFKENFTKIVSSLKNVQANHLQSSSLRDKKIYTDTLTKALDKCLALLSDSQDENYRSLIEKAKADLIQNAIKPLDKSGAKTIAK